MNARDRTGKWQLDLTAATACLLFAAAWYACVLAPLLGQHGRAEVARAHLKAVTRKADAAASAWRSAVAQLDAVRQSNSQSMVRLQPATHVNRELGLITDLAAAAGLEVLGSHVGQPTAGDGCRILPISVEGRGGFLPMLQFLHRLGASHPDVGCAAVRLGDPTSAAAGAAPGAPSGAVAFSVELRWFVLPPDAPPEMPNAPVPSATASVGP